MLACVGGTVVSGFSATLGTYNMSVSCMYTEATSLYVLLALPEVDPIVCTCTDALSERDRLHHGMPLMLNLKACLNVSCSLSPSGTRVCRRDRRGWRRCKAVYEG